MNCPTCGTPLHGVMVVDKLEPSRDWAATATARLVKCTALDFVHFTADFGGGLIAHRLAILSGSERAEAWLAAKAEVQSWGKGAEKAKGRRAKRVAPDWLG